MDELLKKRVYPSFGDQETDIEWVYYAGEWHAYAGTEHHSDVTDTLAVMFGEWRICDDEVIYYGRNSYIASRSIESMLHWRWLQKGAGRRRIKSLR